MGDLTANFDRAEYACKCGCGTDNIKDELAEKVQLVRDMVHRPIQISSGMRCQLHNTTINASPTSSHVDGWAADLAYKGSTERYQLLHAAFQVFNRIGVGRKFIHVDADLTKSIDVVWLY